MPGLHQDGRRRIPHPADTLPPIGGSSLLVPSVQLRSRRLAPALVRIPPRWPATSAAVYPLRQTVSLRARRLNPAQICAGRLLWSAAGPALVTYFIDPRSASVVQTDADPFGVDPRQAKVTT
jgi:hypothetical protein